MQYVLLLFEDEAVMNRAVGDAGFEAYMAPWQAYTQALQEAGALVGGNPLAEAGMATTVSSRNGKTAVQDGPFIDSKEQLGGYYVIEAENLDAAIDWAARCPAALHGHVEVRPVADFA